MLAMSFPRYYTSYTDKKLFGRMEYVGASYNAYQVTYDSFVEKLNAVGKMAVAGGANSVRLSDREAALNYKNINKIVKNEFKDLLEYELLYRKIRLRVDKITSCEKYMLYPSGGNDDIKAITYIKVVYKTKKGNIEVYLDEEYHKIYEIEIPYALYLGKAAKIKGYTISTNKTALSESYDSPDASYFQVLNGILTYYTNNEPNNILKVDYDSIMGAYYSGNIMFSDGTVIKAGRRDVIMPDGITAIQVGISLKEIF